MGCKSSKHAEHAEHEPNGATPSVLHGGFRFEKGAEHGFRTIAVPVDPAQGLGMAIVTLIDPAGLRIDGVVRRSCPRHPAPRCSYIRCPPRAFSLLFPQRAHPGPPAEPAMVGWMSVSPSRSIRTLAAGLQSERGGVG